MKQLSLFDVAIEIPLNHGKVALVDPCDADLLDAKWYALQCRTKIYAARHHSGHKPHVITLHRIIMARKLGRELLPGEQVDHIDGDSMNDRRSNLRLATHAENKHNQGRNKNNTSGYKGVYFSPKDKKWRAGIRLDGKKHCLGLFSTPELAYAAYCKAAIELHGEFARLK